MVEQHEQQHVETMLATHQLRDGEPLLGRGRAAAAGPAGARRLGAGARPGRSRSASTATPSRGRWTTSARRTPSTCRPSGSRGSRSPTREWQRVRRRRRLRRAAVVVARAAGSTGSRPASSGRCSGRADGSRRRFGHRRGDPGRRAGAARLLLRGRGLRRLGRRAAAHRAGVGEGLRLGSRPPAAGAAGRGATRTGRPPLANLGGDALRPAPVGAYAAGASAYGVEQMIGDVWEWTSSGFEPWPGFEPMLYADYSAPFFGGDFRVLRGGSWAVGGASIRPSFRNWDLPIRRQIFTRPAAGLGRCVGTWPGWARRARVAVAGARARARPAAAVLRSRAARRAACSTPTAGASGFYVPGRPEPVRWRSARPLWSDASFASVAPVLSSGCVLAAVRSATAGHADRRERGRAVHRRPLAALAQRPGRPRRCCPPYADAESVCDSAVLAAHVFAAGPRAASARPSREVAAPRPGARRSTCCSPTAHRILGDDLGRPAELPRRARRRASWPASRTTTTRAGSTYPTDTCSR